MYYVLLFQTYKPDFSTAMTARIIVQENILPEKLCSKKRKRNLETATYI